MLISAAPSAERTIRCPVMRIATGRFRSAANRIAVCTLATYFRCDTVTAFPLLTLDCRCEDIALARTY